jgi:hypothetical protein
MLRLLILILAIASTSIVVFAPDDALADHPWHGSGEYGSVNYVYHELLPGGSGRITYRLCDDVQLGIPPTWGGGVERWDNSLGVTLEFDAVASCTATARTELRWTITQQCGAGNWACWATPVLPALFTPHGTHNDIILGLIRFDYTNFTARDNDDDDGDDYYDWEMNISGHEWGHNMSLAEHRTTNCGFNTLMINWTNGAIPADPCTPPRVAPTAPDVGSVRCKVNGCHPNGTLVQVPSGQVYVLHNNTKRYVTSPPVLSSWYESTETVPISASELTAYGDCCPLGYRPGKLVWSPGENKVYFITNEHPQNPSVPEYFLGRKIWVSSPQILSNCFPGKQPITDTSGSIGHHQEGPALTATCSSTGKHPNGTVVINGSSVYVLESGKKRQLFTPGTVMGTWLFAPDLVGISGTEANSYDTVANSVGFRPGRLIQNTSGQIFIVSNDGNFTLAHRRHVFDPMTLNCVFPGESWTPVTDADGNRHPLNPALQVAGTNCGQ